MSKASVLLEEVERLGNTYGIETVFHALHLAEIGGPFEPVHVKLNGKNPKLQAAARARWAKRKAAEAKASGKRK